MANSEWRMDQLLFAIRHSLFAQNHIGLYARTSEGTVTPTTQANDPACLGSYLSLQEPAQPAGATNPHLVMAVGNGDMWVTDGGTGDLEPGNHLISSEVPGCAMKDAPARFPIGYICARAAEVERGHGGGRSWVASKR